MKRASASPSFPHGFNEAAPLRGRRESRVGDDVKKALLRGMDANFNRAKEALRVLEDLSRFCLENRNLTAKLKRLRHSLTQLLLKFPASYRNWLEARDSSGDIGKDNPIQDSSKGDVRALWVSNMKRAQEALRVLEEFSKALPGPQSSSFEKIRFSLYELEKKSFHLF